jgi:predicted DNA-binding protein (MmcQ/YjbR family)
VTLEEYNGFCATLPHTTHVIQWGGAHVWKVAGKVFAIAGWANGEGLAVVFKVSDVAYNVLCEQPDCARHPISPRAA